MSNGDRYLFGICTLIVCRCNGRVRVTTAQRPSVYREQRYICPCCSEWSRLASTMANRYYRP